MLVLSKILRTGILVATLLSARCAPGLAQGGSAVGTKHHFDWSEKLKPQLDLPGYDNTLLGDQIDLQSGALTFHHVDVSLPGNSDLEVAVRRTRGHGRRSIYGGFKDWTLDIPVIRTNIPSSQWHAANGRWGKQRCSQPLASSIPFQARVAQLGGSTQSIEYNHGVILDIPGRGTQQILDSPDGASWPTAAKKVTSKGWYLTCISNIDGAGTEGFYAYAPNGDRYKFDRISSRTYESKLETWYAWYAGGSRVYSYFSDYMNQDMLVASEVTDVHGNKVEYTYDTSGRLTKIESNDGRRIDLGYTGSQTWVSEVIANPGTADARSWTYQYGVQSVLERNTESATPSPTNKWYSYSMLTGVTRPDGRSWVLNLGGMNAPSVPGAGACEQRAQTVSLTHPDGVTGTFELEEQILELGLHAPQLGASCPHTEAGAHPSPRYTDQVVVTSKTLSGAGIPSATWTYEYIPKWGSGSENWAEVTRPDGAMQRSVFKSPYGGYLSGGVPVVVGGVLLREETFATSSSGTPIEEKFYSYDYESPVGNSFAVYPADSAHSPVRQATVRTERGTDWYEIDKTYNLNRASSTYSHGFPTQINQTTSDVSLTRTEIIEYEHNKPKWILGLPKKFTRNGKVFEANTFSSSNGNLLSSTSFQTATHTFAYHSDGNVSSVTDPMGRITQYSSYKRGIPRLIKQAVGTPDEISITSVIDDNGWIDSVTNPRGITTGYAQNSVGWLTQINRPGSWADTSISYSGLGSGVTQTATRGSKRTITTYDGMLRPTLVREQALSGGGGNIYTKSSYDTLGRAVFQSWPSASSTPTDGVNTSYDALGRMTQTQENVSPYATTEYQYKPGNQIWVTDPANALTKTTYRAFGVPATDEVMQVIDPMNGTTDFWRNIHGNVTQMEQSGGGKSVTRNFWYDGRLQLCRHRAPEFGGDELFRYNLNDEITLQSRGESAGTACSMPTASIRTEYGYDGLGRQTIVNFPGSTPDITKGYDPNGNLTNAVRANGTSWVYAYNDLDLMQSETLTVDSRTYAITHNYNSTGNQSSIVLPGTGGTLVFDPDGFGRPTGVRNGSTTYVSAATYHPNGLPYTAQYGNGLEYFQTLNARQLPNDLKVEGDSTVVFLRHSYDPRRKLTSITDYAVTGKNRSFSYDPKGRLLTASGPWGSGSFDYDLLDNIEEKQLGSRTVTIAYNSGTNRVSQVTDSAGGGAQTWSYDVRGNVTDNGPVTLAYDFTNQPTSMSGAGVSSTYTYDGNLKRVKAVQNGKTTYWVYSALTGTPVYQDEVTDSIQTRYVSAGGASLRIRAGIAEYTHTDPQGSPVASTNASGAVLWREHYTPYGEKTVDAAANRNDTGYTGHVQDDLSGLTYMQARYYDPVAARFLSTDPIGYQNQWNLYAYVGNDPVNAIDPLGLYSCFSEGEHQTCQGTMDELDEIMKEFEGYEITGASENLVSGGGPLEGVGGITALRDVGNVYSEGAFGVEAFRHSYVTDNDTSGDSAWGRNGSSGRRLGGEESGVPASLRYTNTIPPSSIKVGDIWVPVGTTYANYETNLKDTGLSGIYIPFINDCHSSLTNSARNVGGAAGFNEQYGGRVDLSQTRK